MLLPLAIGGPSAQVAKAMKQAGEMALFDAGNPAAQLVVKDDRGTPEGARAAAEEAVREGAEIVLGPLYSRAAAGAAPVTGAANIPLVSFSNDRQAAGRGVYLFSFMVEQEVDRIVAFAVSQGRRRFAALIPADAYGNVVEPSFRAAVQRHGGTVMVIERYPVDANAMIAPARRIVAAIGEQTRAGTPVDALFLPGSADTLPQLGPLLAYSGLDIARVKLLGTGAWDIPSLGRDSVFAGGWYPSPDPRGFRAFSERFAKTFGMPPPRIASLAYDAVAIAIDLARQPAGERYTEASLLRLQGFSGVDGAVRFTVGGLPERALAVHEVKSFGSIIIDPAPAFEPGPRLSAAQGLMFD
jgi:ABC-type branched-subunit amino acid transport system substrate-binding protein